MPLEKQVVGVNFTQGLDTQTDKRLVLPGKMVALQNATLSEKDTVRRRDGNTIIVTGTAIASVAALGDQLLALDGTALKTYSSAAQALETAGSVDNITLTAKEVVRGIGLNDSYDAANNGGYTCYVWRHYTSGTVTSAATVAVIDEATGAHVLRETSMRSSANMKSPRVVAVTGAFIIFYFDSGTGTLYSRVIATSAPSTLGNEASLRTDLSTTCAVIDACSSGANAFVYYASSDATNSTRAITVTRSGTTPSVSAGPLNVTTQAQIADNKIAGLTAATFSSTRIGLYVVASTTAGTPGLWAAVVDDTMASIVAAALKDATAAALTRSNITAVLSSGTMFVYSDDASRAGEATASARLIRRTGLDVSNAITSAATSWALSMTRPNGINGPFIAGKAFLVGTSVYVPACMIETGTGTLQNAWFLLLDTGSAFRVAARALYGSWGPPVDVNANIPTAVALSASSVGVPTGQRTLLAFDDGRNVSSTGMARLDLSFATATPPNRGQLGPILTMANGNVSMFDGDFACETGFPLFPEGVTATSTGVGNVPLGTRQILALYEWVDAAGQRHQSAPSPPITYTDAGATTVDVAVPTLTLSQRTAFNVVVFATKASGTIFYRASTLTAPTANSTTASTVTFTYNISDTTLEAGEVLYTTGGVLPNNAPPPCSALAAHQNRLFINPSDDPYATQFSQPWVQGFGVQWNETLRFYVEASGGRPTAYASIDDKLIVFRPRKIGVLFGSGPTSTGASNGYNLQDLPTDVGCSEPRSVLVMPEGVIFKSTSKGWYRLGRDLQLQWIGQGVQAYDSQGVTSAALFDTLKECRFTTNDANGKTLRYAYGQKGSDDVGQWSVDSYAFQQVDATWWPGGNAYVWAFSTGLVKELPATAAGYTYGDYAAGQTTANGGTAPEPNTGIAIPLSFRTGWLKPGEALQAFQRIWRVLLTGEVVGHPQPGTTLKTSVLAGATSLEVWDTSVFVADQAAGGGLGLGLATANYETTSAYTIADATHLTLAVGCANAHSAGATVRGSRVFGARDSLQIDFYFDGNDSAAYQTITISDVNDLINGNTWNVRLQPNLQKCDAIMIGVTATPPSIPSQSAGYVDPGGGINFSGMTMELGVKKGAKKFNAAQTK